MLSLHSFLSWTLTALKREERESECIQVEMVGVHLEEFSQKEKDRWWWLFFFSIFFFYSLQKKKKNPPELKTVLISWKTYMGFTALRQLAQAPINAYRSFAYANSYTLISLLIPDGINEFFLCSLSPSPPPLFFFFSIMFANSKTISGFCVPFFMQEIMGELSTPVIPLSQIIKTTKGTNQSECTAQRLKLCEGLSLSPLSRSLFLSFLFILFFWQEVA